MRQAKSAKSGIHTHKKSKPTLSVDCRAALVLASNGNVAPLLVARHSYHHDRQAVQVKAENCSGTTRACAQQPTKCACSVSPASSGC